jgi:hypothetical protein
MAEQKMLGLFTVFKSNSSHPKGDVIFVHGLAGHPWATWHPQNQTDDTNIDFWPFWLGETLLDEKIDVNIWSFGYEASGFKYFGQGMSRFYQVSNLLEYLKVKNIGDRPFIFVTHSIGGLIVKHLIRTAQRFTQYQTIIEQVQGIVFLSTPHTGIHLSNLIQNINFLTQPTVNVQKLREHSPQLKNLNEWYRQNVEKLGIKTKVFYETKPLNGILVVDEDSYNPGIRDVKPVAISEDYISIAKPGKNDLVCLSTINFCKEVFNTGDGVIELEREDQIQLKIKESEIDSYKRESANMMEITKILAEKTIPIEVTNMATSESSTEKSTKNVEVDMNFQEKVTVAVGKNENNQTVSGNKNNITAQTNDLIFNQNQQSTDEQITATEVVERLVDLEEKIQNLAALSEVDREESIKCLELAKVEVQKSKPDKESIAESLKRVNETLNGAGQTIKEVKDLVNELFPTVTKVAEYLGYAVGTIWNMLP